MRFEYRSLKDGVWWVSDTFEGRKMTFTGVDATFVGRKKSFEGVLTIYD